MIDDAIAELKRVYQESNIQVTVVAFELEKELVGLDMTMAMNMENDEAQCMEMTVRYDRLTEEAGVSHKANMNMTTDEERMECKFDAYQEQAGKADGIITLLSNNEGIAFVYQGNEVAMDTYEHQLSMYLYTQASEDEEFSPENGIMIGTALLRREPADEQILSVLKNATASTSVNVLKLSEEELQGLVDTISTNGMQILYSAMSQLPASTLSLLVGDSAE